MKKILLSTDIGSDVDDALALLVMLNHPDIDLRGIYTVNGDVDARSFIAKHMVNLAGQDIPVARGESKALGAPVPPYTFGEDRLIPEIFIDHERMEEENSFKELYIPLYDAGILTHGIEQLAKQLFHEKHTLFSIGPMTNIAQLIKNYPDSAKNIEKIYAMAGHFPENDSLEHNLRYDSVAAQEVFASDIPITVVPSDVCSLHRMFVQDAEENLETPAGDYVKRMLMAFVGAKTVGEYISKTIGKMMFSSFLRDDVKMTKPGLGENTYLRLEDFKRITLANFDIDTAYFDTEEFWKDFRKLLGNLRNPDYGYAHGPEAADVMESLVPQDVAVHDVYVPYVFLHPDRLMTERKTVTSSFEGRTLVSPGDKHEIVTGFDIPHFKEFIQTYLK